MSTEPSRTTGTPGADVLSGLITGLIVVVSSLSYSALIAQGVLAPLAARLATSALLGAALMALLVGRRSGIPGVVAGPQSAAAAVLANMAVLLPAGLPERARAAALLAALVCAPLLTGLWFIVSGRVGFGRLIRFIPYPVIGGFMAGTGFLLVRGALDLLSGPGALAHLTEPHTLTLCLPGLALAVALLWVPRRIHHPLTVPAILVLATTVFWAVGAFSTRAALQAAGWLLQPSAGGAHLALISPAVLLDVGPGHLPLLAGSIGTIGLVSAISLLLNCTAMELAMSRDIDLNRELVTAGWGNMATALVGGLVGFPYLGTSLVARRMGARGDWTGVTTAAVCLFVALAGSHFLALFPRFVLGGLVLYLGLDMLWDWAVLSHRRLPLVDYAIVLFILVIIGAAGFLPGVFVGCVLATVLFAISYSQAEVVRHFFDGASYRSSVDRHPDQLRILMRMGHRIHVILLQGFLFFGTSNSLVEILKKRSSMQNVGWLVLDLRLVSDIDSSVVTGFVRLHQTCEAEGIRLVLSNVPPIVSSRLVRGGFFLGAPGSWSVKSFEELDQAVEWCEDSLLEEEDPSLPGVMPPSDLFRIFGDPEAVQRLMAYAEVLVLHTGEVLLREGETPDAIFYLDHGSLRVSVIAPNGRRSRLRSLRSGSMVGEIGYFLGQPRVATVEAEEKCRIIRLSGQQLERMRREDPALSATLYVWLVHELAERLAQTNELLKVTMR